MNARHVAGMSMFLTGCCFCPMPVWADSWQQAVSSRVTTEFDTNPAMSPSNTGGVWRGLFEPSYSVMGRIGESEVRSGASVQIARSSNRKLSPDQDSPNVYLNWLRPGDAGEFGISSRYAETATRDAGGVDATGRVPVTSTRASRNMSGSWSKELSAQSVISADGTYEGVSYRGGGAYTNYSTRSGGLKYSHEMNENLTPYFRVSGNKYRPTGEGASSSLAEVTLGLNWKAEYMDGTMQVAKSKVGGGSSDAQGSVTMHYTGQFAQMTLIAGRTISPSGLGGFVKADQVSGTWTYTLNEYSNTGIDLGRQKNLPTLTAGSSTTTNAGVWIVHNLTALWSVRTYCSRRTSQGGGIDALSNIIGLTFSFSNSEF